VARLPLKDANEMLQKGRGAEVIEAIWGAKPYRPDGIMSVDDLYEEAIKDVEPGIDWWLPTLTKWTYGRREGECYAFGAGTGIGKTDWFTQSIAFDVTQLGLTVGLLYLEQPPVETLRRVAGKFAGKPMHIPGTATVEERKAAIEYLRTLNQLHFYNSFGATSWEVVKAKIRYMVVALGCKSVYLDHLTALVAGVEDERKELDRIMAELATLAQELKVYLHFISHLTRPGNGATPHEEGGRVKQAQFRGSNAIGMWAHFMFGLERNTQGEAEEDRLTTFRCLKDRNTGQATGKTLLLDYDHETGLLSETTLDQSSPFRDQSGSATDHVKTEF
jgi:twinkle protein